MATAMWNARGNVQDYDEDWKWRLGLDSVITDR